MQSIRSTNKAVGGISKTKIKILKREIARFFSLLIEGLKKSCTTLKISARSIYQIVE